ncbi:M36 family metallopeptidase [Wenzhouxiangella marina]|uniref:Arginyl aminopeptidase n=1 Tax=Wenzhouxiangella marina TaxID=1579979 RepID=A0A0K0XUW5_9GAMM|nr:M36 family metallopeptidase [Wenzhouxiangella marina]AKS41411.1 arginyl aminopeptidase [Wenzhouxiangella marina]MBB6086835.1 hypothetical protein [Wenzhouxiangella marina]
MQRTLLAAAALCLLTLPAAASTPDQARLALAERADALGLNAQDITDSEVTDDYVSDHTGVRHVWLRQRVDGLPVALALANINLAADGRVWSVNSRFVADAARRTNDRQPTLSARQALAVYARERRLEFEEASTEASRIDERSWQFDAPTMADQPVPVELAWLEHEGRLHLVWQMAVDEKDRSDWYEAWVDAHEGRVLRAVNWTQQAAYRVFPEPLEHPGQGEDQLVSDPADPDASPDGWHTAGTTNYTDTRGNNVFAQEDTDANNADGRRPDGGVDLNFDFAVDLDTQQPAEYEDFAITNLFYWNNLLHDVLWHHGFDEAAGNFQQVNFTAAGLANDAVRADAQDGSGTNNANFGTPPDGLAPRMQMFVWTGSTPAFLRVSEPAVSAGEYAVASASWGEPIGDPGSLGELEVVDDGSGALGSEGCSSLQNFTAGNIALIRRGNCEFGLKALNAEQAGAVAAIIVNSESGNATINMGPGASGGQVTIPVAMIGNDDGNAIIADAVNAITGTLIREGGPALNRDSDLDAGVIAHEYGHGLSNRLTGGPSQASCLSGRQQAGEGWSDFLALWFTAKDSDRSDQPRGVGSYLIFQQNIPGAGIRPAPYIRDLSINPLSYANLQNAGQPGGVSIPHGVGTVLNSAMWDLYWNLVDKYGFDPDMHRGNGGNQLALRLVIDGLKLQPCSPTFLDFRNAVLLADEIANDSANRCEIWDAFARRGMGVNADDGGNADALNVSADFQRPLDCLSDPLHRDRFEAQ